MVDPIAAAAPAAAVSPWAGFATAGLSVLGGGSLGGGGGGGVEDIDQEMSDRSPIHIAPVGVNLGAIMAPFTQGSPETGGYGFEEVSRLMPQTSGSVTTPLYSRDAMANTTKLIIISAAAGVGLIILLKKRKK